MLGSGKRLWKGDWKGAFTVTRGIFQPQYKLNIYIYVYIYRYICMYTYIDIYVFSNQYIYIIYV